MRTLKLLSLAVLFVFISCKSDINKETILNANWKTEKLKDGIILKTCQFDSLFNSKQFISILELSREYNGELILSHADSLLIPTSTIGEKSDALAGINGSFFSFKGGSVLYLRVNDSLIAVNTNKKTSTLIGKSALAFNSINDFKFINADSNLDYPQKNYKNILAAGPRLISNHKILPQQKKKFCTNRHPRTAIGYNKSVIYLITVDGRNKQSAGMSLKELSILFETLGCSDALNLDGGGSTTLWTKRHGVINHPSDNKLFDNKGERAVSNYIFVK